MSIGFILTILGAAFIGSFMSGMLGIGGAIVNYPLLLFVPKLLGFEGFTAHEVSVIVAIQVFFSTLTGVISYSKGGFVNQKLMFSMGLFTLIGGFIGGYTSSNMSNDTINLVYGVLALLAVILMLVPRPDREMGISGADLEYSRILASILSLIIGVGAGIVGAGGAFLLVPVMITILKIPTRITIATSLGITFLSSIGTTTGKLLTGDVLWGPVIVVIIVSVIAAPMGARVSARTNTKYLQIFLAIVIIATALNIWTDILF
ncbi:MAG TPA: sulfite exporter TauE/SafE family protein [Pseudogracilibacillus sp.]|nr:sulfite exporter TauE/SafE family protein [Pseudogracilibacillus sp.]